MNHSLHRKRYNIPIISFILFFFLSGVQVYASPPGHGYVPPGSDAPAKPVRRVHTSTGDRLYFTPACPIVAESFNRTADVNGATADTTSVYGWSLDASKVPNAVYFGIKSHRIKAQTLGGEGVWYSKVIPIAGYTGIQVDAKVSSEGTLSSAEYVKVSYILDGGPETLIEKIPGAFGNDSTPVVTSPQLTGHTVQIVVRMYDTTKGNSEYYIENYDVFKEVGPCTVTSGITVSASASNSGVLTCTNPSTTLSATTTATGTTTYSWTGPNSFTSTSASPVVSTAGTYTVTGTNSAGTGTASVTVTANNAAPGASVSPASALLTCSSPSAILTGSSSTAGVSFKWAGPGSFTASTAAATVTTPGTYTVTVTNPTTGCTATASTTVAQNLTAPANISASNNGPLTCSVTSATLNASSTTTSGVTYAWAGTGNVINYSATGASATVTAPGTYILTATYASTGCTATAMTTVIQTNTNPGTVTVTAPGSLTCSTPSVTLSGSSTLTQGVTYAWTGPGGFTATGTTATATTPGTYTLTATYTPTGCTSTASTTVTQSVTAPAGVTATASGTLTCTTTSVTLTGASTTSGVNFTWTGPNGFTATGATATATAPGTYTVTATNSSTGCTATASTTVTQTITAPAGVTIATSGNVTQLTCSTNFITLIGSSSTSGVTYAWTGPNNYSAPSPITNIFNPGVYTLTVTNPSGGCTSTATITITQDVTAPMNVAVNPSTAQLTCSSPVVTLTGSSSMTGATYAWTGPNNFTATGITTTAFAAGSYMLTATNPANGCTASAAATITQNFAQPAGVTAVNAGPLTCSKPVDTLTGNSTTSGAGYSWTGPGNFTSSSAITTTTAPGTYTLIVTNPANGCTAMATTIVTQNDTVPAGLVISSNLASPVLTCTNTSLSLTASSTTSGVSYNWSGPGGSLSSGAAITVSAAGNYSVVATNPANGCSASAVANVTQNITAPASVGVTTIPANAVLTCSNTSVSLTGSSSVTGANYSWTGPNGFTGSSATATATVPGTYTVTAIDPSNGCSSSATGNITQNVTAPAGMAINTNTGSTVINCTNTSLMLTGSSTTTGVNYSWVGPNGFSAATAAATVTTPGTYTVTATNTADGCTSTAAIVLSQDTATPVAITTSSVPSNAILTCSSPNVVFTGSSSTPGVAYSWTGPNSFTATGAVATVSAPGSYVLTVTNPVNGCSSAVTAASVTQNTTVPIGVLASSSNKLSCFTTSVTLTGSSATAGATYSWTGPDGFSSSSKVTTTSAGGLYTLTATNPVNGCSSSKSLTVLADTATPAGVTASNSGPLTCDITTVTLTGNSTTPGVTYTWTGPNGFFDMEQVSTDATDSGEYILTVSNPGNGCITNVSTTVTQDLTACSMVIPKVTNGRSTTLNFQGPDSARAGITQFEYKVYPNPVSSTAFIEFRSPSNSPVSVAIYSSLGVLEKTLFSNTVEANQSYKLTLDAGMLAAGVHYCMIRVNNKLYTSKLLLLPNRP